MVLLQYFILMFGVILWMDTTCIGWRWWIQFQIQTNFTWFVSGILTTRCMKSSLTCLVTKMRLLIARSFITWSWALYRCVYVSLRVISETSTPLMILVALHHIWTSIGARISRIASAVASKRRNRRRNRRRGRKSLKDYFKVVSTVEYVVVSNWLEYVTHFVGLTISSVKKQVFITSLGIKNVTGFLLFRASGMLRLPRIHCIAWISPVSKKAGILQTVRLRR